MTDPVQAPSPAPVAAPVVAPVAAPAAPAAAPVAAPELPQLQAAPAAPAAPEPAPKATFEPTGDPLLDTALDYVAGLGIASTDPVIEAARDGDFAPLEAKLAAMGDKAKDKDRYLALAKRSYAEVTAKAEKHNTEVAAIVHGVAGGAAQWEAIKVWASANATDKEKADVNAAFAAGGVQAKATAEYLVRAFTRAGKPGLSKLPATDPNAAAAPTGTLPLSARDYARQVDELSRKHRGGDVTHLPEYQALRARRMAARANGQ